MAFCRFASSTALTVGSRNRGKTVTSAPEERIANKNPSANTTPTIPKPITKPPLPLLRPPPVLVVVDCSLCGSDSCLSTLSTVVLDKFPLLEDDLRLSDGLMS